MEFLPFSKLSDVSVSPRVRNLLETGFEIQLRHLESGLRQSADEFEKQLFKQAERASSSDAQTRLLSAIKECKRKRVDMESEVRRALQNAMLSVVDHRLYEEDTHAAGASLSLVDESDLEQSLCLAEISAKHEVRNSLPLSFLAIRFAVIGGGVPVAPEHLPCSPQAICRFLGLAGRQMDLDNKIRVLFYNTFERTAMVHYGQWLEALNRFFMDARIMPNLHAGSGRARPPIPSPAGKQQVAPAEAESQVEAAVAQAAPPPSAPPTAPPARFAPEALAPAQSQPFVARRQFSPETGAAAYPSAQASTQASTQAPTQAFADAAQDREMFNTLRELLSGRRASGFDPVDGAPMRSEPVDAGPPANTDDLQSVLTILQAQHVAPVMVNGRWMGRRISHIKQDALNQLRAISGGKTPVLKPEDADTLDLVGMLFDNLMQDARPTSTTHNLLSKLQVPLLKVALQDKSFFTRRQHPARQLLNAIAETSIFWVEDEGQDRPVIEKMQMVVDRVCSEFDSDVAIFDSMLGDLGRHVETLQKKADVSERRHVEAARGRERLDLARARATEAMEKRVRDRPLPDLVKTLLGDAWADLLALTLLRQGDDSAAYQAQLDVADELIACFLGNLRSVAREHYETIRPALSEGLSLVGFHADEIDLTLDGVAETLPRDLVGDEFGEGVEIPLAEPKPEVLEAVAIVKEKTKATKEEKITILASLRKTEKVDLTPKEQSMIERIKQLPFGTWFEFQVNQQGEAVRRKLSWFSTVTGRCLFVNARGAKVEERTIEQLAKDLVRGNARVWEEQRETLLDRTWNSLVGKLKQWSGMSEAKTQVGDADASGMARFGGAA